MVVTLLHETVPLVYTEPPIPTPPVTINAPVEVVEEAMLALIFTIPVVAIEPPTFTEPPIPTPP